MLHFRRKFSSSVTLDTPQGMADALGYLQHHLQELTERQHVSESNINSTLAALTAQLQQLTQLVANPPLPLPHPSEPLSLQSISLSAPQLTFGHLGSGDSLS